MSKIYPETPLGSPSATGDTLRGILDAKRAELEQVWDAMQAPAVAPELAAAMAESRLLRSRLAMLCTEFNPSPQSGYSARISRTVLNRYREAAELEPLKPGGDGDREDALLRYRRERDEALERINVLAADVQVLEDDNAALAEARDRWQHSAETIADQRDELRRELIGKGDELQRVRAENAAHTHIAEEAAELQQQLADVRGIATDPVHGATAARKAIVDYLTPKTEAQS